MIGGDYQAIIDEEDFRRRSSPSKKGQNSSPSRRGRSLLLPESPAPAAAQDMAAPTTTAIKLTRKCGTPFCTLPDFHDGPCSCTVVSSGRRTAKQAPEPVKGEAVPRGVALEQNRLSGLVKKRGREPAWRLDCPKGEKRRATGRQRSNISLSAAERREAGQGAACLRGWSGAERDLFALGIGLYGKDMRAIRHTLLPARSLAELVAFYYLQPSVERSDAVGAVGAPTAAPADCAGSPACCECAEPMAEPGWRCTSSVGCPHSTCSRCRDAAIPSGSLEGDVRAHSHFWVCAPCSGQLRAAHRALLALAHAACVSCGSIKPAAMLGSNPWLRGVSTCSPCLARFALPVACTEAAARGEETTLAPLCCQLCTSRDGRAAHACSAEGCPHSVCSRCILRCAGQECLDQLAADKEGRFQCALHDATLKCAVIRWTRQALS